MHYNIRSLLTSLLFVSLSISAHGENVIKDLLKPVQAEPYWLVQMSVYTRHFSPKPHHNNHQNLIGIERNREDSYLWGAAAFTNSFDQSSVFAYVGKRFDYGDTPFYSRLTFGFIHGYRGEFEKKVPFNRYGIAPVILPSFGMKYNRVQSDIILLGLNAGIVTLGVRI